MILADTPTSTFRLLCSGPLAGWAGALLFLAAGVMVIWQLRRDFARMRATRVTRWVLPVLRLAIVGTIAWLLCQPMLLVERHWTPPAHVLLVVDTGKSMRVNESAGGISRELDMLEAVGKPLARRNNAASRAARACGEISRAASAASAALQEDQGAASTGLPLGPAVGRKLDALAAVLREQGDALISARAQMTVHTEDKALAKSLEELASMTQVLGAAVDGLIADGVVVGREAPRSPSMLDGYMARLKKLVIDSDSTRKRAADVQTNLDKALLTAHELDEIRAKPMTRQGLADMAADRLATVHSAGSGQAPSTGSGQEPLSWDRAASPDLATALDDAFAKSLSSPLAGVVVLSDGSSALPAAPDADGDSLKRLRLPVSTVLIGADGEEPADAGLVAIDVPRLALAGDVVTVRCLVKNLITGPAAPKLTLTVAKQVIATRDLAVSKDGYDVVEFPWTPAAPGRTQLVFHIDTAQGDAYPGNESSAAMVDVISDKARALVVSDRLTGDFAAVSQLLAAMPAVEMRSILAAPGLSKFQTGSKADEFPATLVDFGPLSLLVLIGDVPKEAGGSIGVLKDAIDAGLCVWVQSPAPGRSTTSWASLLGLETRPLEGRHSIEPVSELWMPLYELGRESDESAARWKELPQVESLSEIVTPGIPLLTAGGRPVLELVPRKGGAVIVTGISDFSALRGPASAASVNRLLSESLLLGLAPLAEPSAAGGMFPPQPVLGRDVFLIGDASAGKGLDPAPGAALLDSAKRVRVTDPQAIGIQAGGASIERAVRQLLSRHDFQLAAHAAPLQHIAMETGGQHRDLQSLMDVVPQGVKGTPMSSATRWQLWPGAWSLVVLLALVSAEYLLRRRAGKVM